MDRLRKLLFDALNEAREQRDLAGRSERGRHLSIVVTDLETVVDRLQRARYAAIARPDRPREAYVVSQGPDPRDEPTPGEAHAKEVASAIAEGRTAFEVVTDDPTGEKARLAGS
jgi:hypothetical protein